MQKGAQRDDLCFPAEGMLPRESSSSRLQYIDAKVKGEAMCLDIPHNIYTVCSTFVVELVVVVVRLHCQCLDHLFSNDL